VDLRAATSEELAEPIAAAGLTRAKSPTRAVSRALGEDPRFRRLSDRRWAVPRELLDGAVLTHRPTPQEVDNAALSVVPDLAPLVVAGLYGIMTVDGTLLTPVWDSEAQALTGTDTDTAVRGHPGWLAGADGEPLLHIRLKGGALAVTWGPEPAATARMSGRRVVETIRRALDRQPRTESIFGLPPTVPLSEALLLMVIDDPELLREPLVPLGRLFEEAGLETHQGWVGYPGTDWELLDDFMDFDPEWDPEDAEGLPSFGREARPDDDALPGMGADEEQTALTAQLAETFGLGEGGAVELQAVLGALELSRHEHGLKDPALLGSLAAIVANPAIAHVLTLLAGSDADLEPFAAKIEKAASGSDAAGPRYVLAASAEARNDVIEAERQLRATLDADPGFFPAALELARFETDRARYGEALQLLISVGIEPDDPERAWLEDLNQSALPKVGRNEPCPCGSGRKYKTCHLGREGDLGSVDPAKALLHKLWLWLDRPRGRRLVHGLVVEIVPDSARPEQDDKERERLDGPILDDIVLYDRGELERFIRVRSELLPERERDLGQSWLTTRRSLYEVRSVRPGRGLTVRDLLEDGADVALEDRALSSQVESLDLLCGRLVPDGSGGHTPSAGLLIPRSQRTRVGGIVQTGDPMALLRWLARPDPMPKLSNTEGEPLRLVDATYRVPDPAAAAKALGRKLRREDEDERRFVEVVARDGQDLIRGSITLDGDVARVEANSEKRADRLERILMRAAPGTLLIRREEQGVEEAIETFREEEGGASGSRDTEPADLAADPAIAAAMEQMMRDYEQRWVSDSIPALGGMTPRQALEDPEMRRELEAMLDDMAWDARRVEASGTTGTMDPDRIRELLGISTRGKR